ncbi:hypothetical protein ACFT5C_24710 [Streptomyces sp. NPDC057116]|uniref:hypothetical protein n=1 Tax=Streptomyces sp. NPDC057116 TaxID=3346023 RepID=UPI003634D01B
MDKQVVMGAFSEWHWDKTVREVARSNPYVPIDRHVSTDGTYAYSDRGGASLVSCPVAAKEHPGAQLFVRILLYEGGTSDAAASNKLLQAYAKSVADSPECAGPAL